MDSGMRLAKIKEQLIITWNGIFRNSAAIANVQGKRKPTAQSFVGRFWNFSN
jgi:hypothetical protein